MKNSKIREDIKKLSEEQIVIKPQRKTNNFLGVRTVDAYSALLKSNENKEKLRHLYVAYNVLRNKEVIPFKKRQFSQALVDKYVKEYEQDFLPKTEE